MEKGRHLKSSKCEFGEFMMIHTYFSTTTLHFPPYIDNLHLKDTWWNSPQNSLPSLPLIIFPLSRSPCLISLHIFKEESCDSQKVVLKLMLMIKVLLEFCYILQLCTIWQDRISARTLLSTQFDKISKISHLVPVLVKKGTRVLIGGRTMVSSSFTFTK